MCVCVCVCVCVCSYYMNGHMYACIYDLKCVLVLNVSMNIT